MNESTLMQTNITNGSTNMKMKNNNTSIFIRSIYKHRNGSIFPLPGDTFSSLISLLKFSIFPHWHRLFQKFVLRKWLECSVKYSLSGKNEYAQEYAFQARKCQNIQLNCFFCLEIPFAVVAAIFCLKIPFPFFLSALSQIFLMPHFQLISYTINSQSNCKQIIINFMEFKMMCWKTSNFM